MHVLDQPQFFQLSGDCVIRQQERPCGRYLKIFGDHVPVSSAIREAYSIVVDFGSIPLADSTVLIVIIIAAISRVRMVGYCVGPLFMQSLHLLSKGVIVFKATAQ